MTALIYRVAAAIYRAWKYIANQTLGLVNTILKPDTRRGRVSGKTLLKFTACVLIFLIGMAVLSAYSVWALFGLIVVWLLIFVTATASHAVIFEEAEIMDGLLERCDRTILSPGPAKTGAFLVSLAALNIIALSAIAYGVAHTPSVAMIWPACGYRVLDYGIHTAAEIPAIGPLISKLCNNTRPNYVGWSAKGFQTVVQLSTAWTIVTIFWWLIARQVRMRMAFNALIQRNTPSATRHYLQFRLARAPSETKRSVLQLALGPAAKQSTFQLPAEPGERARIQKLAINMAPHAEILTYPLTFIWHLHEQQDEYVKRLGLVKAFEIMRTKYEPGYIVDERDAFRSALRNQLFDRPASHSIKVNDALGQMLVWVNEQE